MRWLETLSENKIEIEYRPGKFGLVPDALSRAPHVAEQPATFDSSAEASGTRGTQQALARSNVAAVRTAKVLNLFAHANLNVSARLMSIVVEPSFLSLVSRS